MRHGLTGDFETLSPRDAAFLYDEGSRNHEMLVACYVFGAAGSSPAAPPPAVSSQDGLREWMRRRLGAADFLTRRIRRAPFDAGLPCWIPAEPALSDHVHLHRIAGGPGRATAFIAALASSPVDLSRPPWELHAITGARGADAGLDTADTADTAEVTVIVLKVHHCAADGMGLRAAEAALFSEDPPPVPPPPRTALRFETAARAIVGAPYRTLRFALHARRTQADVTAVARRIADGGMPAPVRDRPATRFDAPLSGTLTVAVRSLRIDDLRAARSAAPGATVNDVLLTAAGGAMRRLLRDEGELPDAALAALVPISLRLPDAASGRTRKRSGRSASTANQLHLGTVDLHTDIADPTARLAAVAASAAAEKARWMDPQVRRAESRMDAAPAWLLRLRAWAQRRARPGELRLRNTMVSNLPAPPGAPTFDGAQLAAAFGVLPVIDGGRVRHLFTSCGDHVFLSVTSDSDAVPDAEGYADEVCNVVKTILFQVN